MSNRIKTGDQVQTRDGHTGTVSTVYVSDRGDDRGLESAEMTLENGEFRRGFTANLRKQG
jgi:hypothetical protein